MSEDQSGTGKFKSVVAEWMQDVLDSANKHHLLPMDGLYVYGLQDIAVFEVKVSFTDDGKGEHVAMTEIRAGAAKDVLRTVRDQ